MIDALLQALASSQKTVAELRNEIISGGGGGSKRRVEDESAAAADVSTLPEGTKTKKSKKEPKKEPKKAPKAATPYNLYVKEQSVLVRAPPGEMMKVIAQQWNALGAEGKQSYVDAAKVAKDAMHV